MNKKYIYAIFLIFLVSCHNKSTEIQNNVLESFLLKEKYSADLYDSLIYFRKKIAETDSLKKYCNDLFIMQEFASFNERQELNIRIKEIEDEIEEKLIYEQKYLRKLEETVGILNDNLIKSPEKLNSQDIFNGNNCEVFFDKLAKRTSKKEVINFKNKIYVKNKFRVLIKEADKLLDKKSIENYLNKNTDILFERKNGKWNYYAGNFSSRDSAELYAKQNNKTEIINSLFSAQTIFNYVTNAAHLKQKYYYRIQVLASTKPIDENTLSRFRFPEYKLYIDSASSELIKYNIGNFNSREEAESFKSRHRFFDGFVKKYEF